jgi:hypothetical protein
MKILTTQELLDTLGYIKFTDVFCDELKRAAKAQADLTLKEIIEWGESDCPHCTASKTRGGVTWHKRECLECWANLKKGEIK